MLAWRPPMADETEASPSHPKWPSLGFAFEQVSKQLDLQGDLWDSADRRLQLVLGVTGVVFAVVLGLERPSQAIPVIVGVIGSIALALFLAASSVAVLGYWPREFDRPPKPSTLRDIYLTTAEEQTKLEVLDTMLLAYDANGEELERKFARFKVRSCCRPQPWWGSV